jgi:hypothetical protein
MRRGTSGRLACLALVLLVGLGASEAADASSRILLRFTVVSFDSPITQLFDELVCETSPTSQAGAEAGQANRLATGVSARLAVPSVPSHPESAALSSGITRSPPAA